jgi:3'(2'), 5'-bisphosphate nucleotidase
MPPVALSADTCTHLLDGLTEIASRAGAAILAIDAGNLARREKADQSPVTAADEAAEAVILAGLRDLLPGTAVISEEAGGSTEIGDSFVLVDPLDGTREFLAGRDEFTVNIGLIRHARPVLGVVAAPALGLIWRGVMGQGAERLRLAVGQSVASATERTAVRTRPFPEHPVAAVSRSHLDPASESFLAQWQQVRRISCGSALKFCRLAEGAADLYPRLAPTMAWDVAAGHAVLAAAGGTVTDVAGRLLAYGGTGFRIASFVAWGDPRAVTAV